MGRSFDTQITTGMCSVKEIKKNMLHFISLTRHTTSIKRAQLIKVKINNFLISLTGN